MLITVLLAQTSFGLDLGERLSPNLMKALHGPQKLVNVVAYLQQGVESPSLMASNSLQPARSAAGHRARIENLKQQNSTERFREFLSRLSSAGEIENVRGFWIADAVAFSISSELLEQVAAYPGLYYLVDDTQLQLIEPVSTQQSESGYAGSSRSIDLTGVREMWNRGYTGHGRLVCNFDTGVDGDHPALSSSWYGINGGSTGQSWFDPLSTHFPVDLVGHGTHTMGIMVGRDGSDTIGVAFNARWISAAVVDRGQSLNKTISDILAAFQWAADPDGNSYTVDDVPDVVCNSWGIPKGLLAPCDQTFWQAIDNLEALGVATVFACGNEGPNPLTIRNPADRASGPLNSFSVGAVDQSQPDLPIAEFSSRGPANCDQTSIKPEIVAPGIAIRSSYKDSTYKVISGTSMAAPFVAGCITLMREYNPEATVAEIKNALILSAKDLGPHGEDNDYGWGFIDVAKAIEYLPTPDKPNESIVAVELNGSPVGTFPPGNTTQIDLVVLNEFASVIDLRATMRSLSPYASILVDTACYGTAVAGETLDHAQSSFLVKLGHETPHGILVDLAVDFYSAQHGYLNSAEFSLFTGQPLAATQSRVETSQLSYSVTNFGISRGLYSFAKQANLLSLLSLVVADEFGSVYDGLPGNLDFEAVTQQAGQHEVNSVFQSRDARLEVSQKTSVDEEAGQDDFVLVEYVVSPERAAIPGDVSLGLALDFDLTGGETLLYDDGDFLFRSVYDGSFVGVRLLGIGELSGKELPGTEIKSGALTELDKFQLISETGTQLSGGSGDLALMAEFAPLSPAGGEELEFQAIIGVGENLAEVKAALTRGEQFRDQATDVDESGVDLPESFSLEQNYPNPFNNQTVVEFFLPVTGDYRFDVFNILGQHVYSQETFQAQAGRHLIQWSGVDDSGYEVASGTYLYRITFGGNSQTRKMVLLK